MKKVTRCCRDLILDILDRIYQENHVITYLEDEGGGGNHKIIYREAIGDLKADGSKT